MNNTISPIYNSPIGTGFKIPAISSGGTTDTSNFNAGGGIGNSAQIGIGNIANSIAGVLNAPGSSTSSGNLAGNSSSFSLPSSSPNLNTGLNPNIGNAGNLPSNGVPAPTPVHPVVSAITSGAQAAVNNLLPDGGAKYANSPQPTAGVGVPAPAGGFDPSQSSNGQQFTGYNVSVPDQTNSKVLGAGLTYADALNSRNQLMQDYINKANQAAQYQGQNMSNQLQAQYSGDTQDYGTGAASLYRAESQGKLLTNQLQTQNALTALQSQQSFANQINPFQNQVSPGSTAYNPATGQPVTSGLGASPQVINSTAMQLAQMAQSQGTAQYNSDGSLNLAPYIAQAQQIYGGGGMQSGMNGGGGMQSGMNIPPAVQSYMQASGGQYINANKVPAGQQQIIQNQATQAGIPYLTGDEANKMQNIQVTQANMQQLSQVSSQILGSGLYGRTIGAAWNNIASSLQLNPTVSSFNAYRTLAVNSIQALAGGSGSGFRLNQAEINTAQSNLPTINDNLQTAQAKMQILNGFLTKWQSELLTGNPNGGGSSSSGGSLYDF